MSYIQTHTGAYPLSEQDIRAANPNTSFGTPFTPPSQYAWVFPTPQPAHDAVIRRVQEAAPVLTNKGTWEQRWQIVPRFAEYTDAQGVTHTVAQQEAAAIAADLEARMQALRSQIVASTQARLESFAATRNYSSLEAISKYKDISDAEIDSLPAADRPLVAQFRAESRYLALATAQTWAVLYRGLAEVQSGTRPMPSGYAEIESELPVLEWPV